MSSSAETRPVVFRRCALAASVLAALVALAALAGSILHVPPLQTWLPGHHGVSPLTAVLLVFSALALHCQHQERTGYRIAGHIVAGLVLLVAVIVFVGNLTEPRPDLGQAVAHSSSAGAMPSTTALLLMLIGLGLLTINARRHAWQQLSEALALATVAVSLLVLVGYAYREVALTAIGRPTPVALNTAIASFLLGVSMLCARPQRPIMALVISDSLGGMTLRRLLPAAVLVPVLLVWLRLIAEQQGWVDRRLGMALFALSNVAVFAAIVFWNAGLLDRMYQRHQETLQELRISNERALNIINSAYDAFVAMNAEGEIMEWNRQAEVTFGWRREEVIGRQVSDIMVPPQYRQAHSAGLAHFVETGEAPLLNKRVEITALHHDGHELPVELTISAMRVASAWLFGAFVHDITARKKVDAELHRAKEAAEAANRAKSEFLANMSHEIRTPLNGVLGMTELVLETDLSDEQREYLELAKTSADYLLAVINDILDFSKIEAGKLELETIDFDLRDVVDEAVASLALRAHRKGLELLSHVVPEVPWWLAGDPVRLRQVLMNLVGNAVKFTDRGEVVVQVELESLVAGDVALHFSVSDTGIGIPADRQTGLFQAFSQVDSSTTRKYGGTGLGLAISYSLVRMMNGRLWLESQEGRGSTFHFTARFQQAQLPSETAEGGETREFENLSVLVVDDNAMNRRILSEMLSNWHMRPVTAENGRQALELLEKSLAAGEPFDLVLLDNNMPGMDGYALAETIKQHPGLVGATVMMLSSADRHGDTARLRALGLAAYLPKPIKQSELLNSIVNVLALSKNHSRRVRVMHQPVGRAARSLHLLLAEDNPINQRVAVRLLEKRGHSVVVCNNGREALAAIQHEPFDAILLDVQMPELDGLETTAAIRAQERAQGGHVPIVAMTAHAMKGDREQCFEAGMDAYVAKPLVPQKLFETLEGLFPVEEPSEPAATSPPPVAPSPPRAPATPAAPAASAAFSNRGSSNGAGRPADGLPVFDAEAALGRVEGDRQLLAELIDIFLKQCDEWKAEIRDALTQHDATRLHRGSHTLKGAAGNLGFEAVADRAQKLEALDASADWTTIEAAAADLEHAIGQIASSPDVLAASTAGEPKA